MYIDPVRRVIMWFNIGVSKMRIRFHLLRSDWSFFILMIFYDFSPSLCLRSIAPYLHRTISTRTQFAIWMFIAMHFDMHVWISLLNSEFFSARSCFIANEQTNQLRYSNIERNPAQIWSSLRATSKSKNKYEFVHAFLFQHAFYDYCDTVGSSA